jgi:selenide,water dikinase
MANINLAANLTSLVKAGGCASKLSPALLDQVLKQVPRYPDPNVLVGFDTADDAGVYRLSPDLALVQTVDFFTPIVDDPYTFGAIAATNAISDIYAMGGRPITSVSIVTYPAKGDLDVLAAIMTGGADKMREAGCAVLGGHSVNDDEPKFGYAVSGLIHPDHIKTNTGARPGDALVFTKRIGTGVISTALKRGIADPSHVAASVESMTTLNRVACETMLEFDVHACTDVTGFGLIGHSREMALGSSATLVIQVDAIRFLPGAIEYARQGAVPGGQKNNFDFASCVVEKEIDIAPEIETLLYDPQTAGGLLIALPERDADLLLGKLPGAYRIGRVLERGAKPITLT